jgi:MFS family permease
MTKNHNSNADDSQQITNLYAPPPGENLSHPTSAPSRELHPLWIWLAIMVLTTFLGTPADPISKPLALAYGLLCFWVGYILGSRTRLILRLLPLVLCIAAAAWLTSLTVHYHIAISACYGLMSIGIGMWANRRIQRGQLRIVACFSAGYAIGSLVGPLGTVLGAAVGASDTLWWVLRQCPLGTALGAVAGAVLARRSLSRPRLPDGG